MINVGEVAMIPLHAIRVEDRTRQTMGDLDGIEKSIKDHGLIQPLAVKALDNGIYQLLAGERRFIVLERNKVKVVPVRIFRNDPDKLEMKSIELAENFYRKDFEYWETDNLLREIHELQQKIFGQAAPGPGGEGWTLKDTAQLAGVTDASVSTAIKRSEAREAYPELFEACRTQKDATKMMKKMDEMVTKEEIARKIESNRNDNKMVKISKCFILGSFFEGVKQIPDKVFHLVEIDPPYAIGLKDVKKTDGESQYVKDQYNEIPQSIYIDGDKDHPWKGMKTLFNECYRVMADHSWLICWFAPEPWFNEIYNALNEAGFDTTRMCGIWTKGFGQSMQPETRLSNSYEMFFYAWKGKPVLNKAGRSNDFRIAPVPAQQKVHETERPIELMREIYDTFAFTGSRVLIPFLGSGNGIIAADQLGMSPIGFELTKSYRDSFLVKVHNLSKGIQR